MYTYDHIAHPPPNGPTAGGSRVLARSREKQQNNKLTKTKKPKKPKKPKKNIFSKTMGLGPPKDGFFGFLEKKMVFLVRNHLFLEKMMVLSNHPSKNHLFLEKKMVLPGEDLQKPSFSREKVSNQKNHLFLEKTKKTKKTKKKTSFGGPNPIVLEKMVFFFFLFFWFSREKDGFLVRNHLFLEKKMVLSNHPSKNHLFLEKKMVLPGEDLQKPSFSREKDGFEPNKPSFSRENQKNQKNKKKKKKNIFWRPQPHSFGKDGFLFFLFFGFLEKKMVFWFETIFFSRKRWLLKQPPSKNHPFSREKDGFTRRRPPKTIFFSRKRWFRTKKTIFFSRKPNKPSFRGPSPIVLEKMLFLVFWFFWFLLVFLVFSRKRCFFGSKPSFPREKMVLSNNPSNNHLCREKGGFTRRSPPKTSTIGLCT